MSQRINFFSFSTAFLLMAVLINISIVIIAYSISNDFYWALLVSIPALAFAIYYQRIVFKKGNSRGDILDKQNNIVFSNTQPINELNVLFGNNHCEEPYLSSIFCIDAGTPNKQPGFDRVQINFPGKNKVQSGFNEAIEDTSYRNDVIWQINPGYAGCRDNNFNFNRDIFKLNASRPSVKMIELRLSVPLHGRSISSKENIHSSSVIRHRYLNISLEPITKHTAFANPESMAIFLDSLRQLSGKKPVGIRLSINDEKEFHELCYAFRKTDIVPDYIVIENDAHDYNSLQTGQPCLYEALQLVSRTLEIYGLKGKIKIIAATEIYSAMDVLKVLALGADAISMNNKFVNSSKNFTTENAQPDNLYKKSKTYFQHEILNATINTVRAWGYKNVKEITLPVFFRNIESLPSRNFAETIKSKQVINPAKSNMHFVKQNTKIKHREIAFN